MVKCAARRAVLVNPLRPPPPPPRRALNSVCDFTMDAQAPVPESPVVSDKEQLNAPPGWTKKLVPTKAKGFTPNKYDAIFIAPDGQEVQSKWHLQRYLKAHPNGPAISEFIWSSGEETPIRRSARFATRESSETKENTPKKQGKRNASEIDGEVIENDQVKTPPRKRAKKDGKSGSSVNKGAAGDAADGAGNDEVMHDVQDGTMVCGGSAAQDETPNGGLQIDKGNGKQVVKDEASKEAVTEKLVVEEPSDEKQLEDVNLTTLEENTVSEVTEQSEPVVTNSEANGIEQQEVELKVSPEMNPSAIFSGELKDDKISMESQKLSGCVGHEIVEPKEPVNLNFGDKNDVSDSPLINSDKVSVEAVVIQELLDGGDKTLEPLIQKKEQERLLNSQNSPLRVEHGQEKKASGESNHYPVPVSMAN